MTAQSSVKVIMTGDARKLRAEQAKAAKGQRDVDRALSSTAGQTVAVNRHMASLGQRYAALNASPIERARKRMSELSNTTVKAQLTQEQYDRAVSHTVATLARQEGISAKVAARQLGVNQRYADAANKMKAVSDAGGRMTARLLAIAGPAATVTTAIRAIGAALQFTREETEKAVQSMAGLEDSRRRLSQIAVDDKDLQQLEDTSDQLAKDFGVDRDIVRRVIFSARSEGFEDAVPEIIQNAPIIAPEAAAGVAGQVPGLFKGEQLAPVEAIAGTLTAAKASRLDFESIAQNLPKVAEGGALANSSFAESAGVLSVMASRFASAETAADRMKAFATALATREIETPDGQQVSFAGAGIIEGFEMLQSSGDEVRKKFLGDSQELNAAFELLSQELPTVKQRIGEINRELNNIRSGGPSILQRQRESALSQETEIGRRRVSLIQKRRAEIGREIANEKQFAEVGAERAAAVDRVVGSLKDQDVSTLEQSIGQKAGEIAGFLGASPEATETATAGFAALPSIVSFDLQRAGKIIRGAEDARAVSQQSPPLSAAARSRVDSGAPAERPATIADNNVIISEPTRGRTAHTETPPDPEPSRYATRWDILSGEEMRIPAYDSPDPVSSTQTVAQSFESMTLPTRDFEGVTSDSDAVLSEMKKQTREIQSQTRTLSDLLKSASMGSRESSQRTTHRRPSLRPQQLQEAAFAD